MRDINPNFHKLVHYFNPDIQLELAKPNKLIEGNLTEAYNISMNLKLGQIIDLSFSIPYSVEKNFLQVKNKNVDKIKQRYLLRASYLNTETWFIIADETDDLNDTNIKHVTAYSLGYQLTDKYIRQWAGVFIDGKYRKESLNAKQVMDSVLSETTWSYDVVKSDTLFISRYRAFDFSGISRLEAVINIAETFNAIIEWDTHNKKIIFHDIEKYGSFRGLFVSDSKYLNSYEKVTKSSEMATRLKLYGKDGLTINEINPSGMDYIEDLSYFLKGFSMDSHENIITHSAHATDGLCKAIIKYQTLVNSKNGQFTSLLSQKESLQSQLKVKENELFNLKNELVAIQVDIDFAESQGHNSYTFKIQESNKNIEITNKQSEIATIKSNIATIDARMIALKSEISIENNFTYDQLQELDNFIIEKTWENENISDAKELFELGKKELEKLNSPNTTYNIGLVYLLRIAEAQRDVKKLRLGDKIRIQKKEIDEIVEAQIIEMQIDFDGKKISLTIANFSTNKNDEDEVAKLIYNNSVATSTINMNKSKWDDISNVGNFVNEVLNNTWDSAKREIESGAMQSVIVDNRGITTIDMTDPNKFVRIMGGIVGLTTTGGQTFKTAITGSHIVAEVIQGRLIIGQNMYMENEAGKFRFDQDGVTIKGTSLNIIADDNSNLINYWNSIEQNAKVYADELKVTINEEILDVSDSLLELETEIKSSFKDGLISEAEAIAISKYKNSLDSEKADVDSKFNTIYNDVQLTNSGIKSTLNTKKINYNNAHSALLKSIDDAIADNKTTEEESKNVDTKFTLYRTALPELSIAFENAINNIAQTKASIAEQNAKDAAVLKGDTINGVKIDTSEGLTITRGDGKVKSTFNATDGIKIQTKKGTTWNNEFYYDILNERLVVDGEINARVLKINGKNVLTNNGKIDGAQIANLVVGETVTMGANASLSWTQVYNKPWIPTSASDIGAVPNYQSSVFNTLTNYGASKGLFMSNGQLYINADYINAGRIKANRLDLSGIDAITTISDAYGSLELAGNSIFGYDKNNTILYGLRTLSASHGNYGELITFHQNGRYMSFGFDDANTARIAADLRLSTLRVGSGTATVDIFSRYFTFNGDSVATQSWVNANTNNYLTPYITQSTTHSGTSTYTMNTDNGQIIINPTTINWRSGISLKKANIAFGWMGIEWNTNDLRFTAISGDLRLNTPSTYVTVGYASVGLYVRNGTDSAYAPAYASNFVVSSREEWKKNIEEFTTSDKGNTALHEVMDTKVYKYHLKDDDDQELKRIGLIYETTLTDVLDLRGQGIDTYSMVSVLWKAVQELNEKVTLLEEKILTNNNN